MYDFDKVVDRRGTSSIKWNVQWDFGQKDGLLPFWIADTDFASEPKILEAMKKDVIIRFLVMRIHGIVCMMLSRDGGIVDMDSTQKKTGCSSAVVW